jgi:hypothetical protein
MRADPVESPQEASLFDRQERILALEELRAMRILNRDEFVAEMKRVTEPQPDLRFHVARASSSTLAASYACSDKEVLMLGHLAGLSDVVERCNPEARQRVRWAR